MDGPASAVEQAAFRPIVWDSPWERFFLLATAMLTTTILLKFGGLQWLEILYFAQIGLIFLRFLRRDLRTTWFRPYLWLTVLYLIFMIAATALGLASRRFQFYIPVGLPTLLRPGYITASRVAELFESTFIMLWLADVFRRQLNKLRFTMRVYFWVGVASAVYSYISYPIDLAGSPNYGSYNIDHRFRGFYNEGGPYGLYLLTIIFVGLALYSLRWETVLRMRIGLALLPVAFYKSYSKAAFTAMLALLLINGLFTRGLGKRVVLLGGMAVVALLGVRGLHLTQVIELVDSDPSGYERESHLHNGDGNYVYGRVAARFIVPRMIAAHPYSGIGWGNYGTLRNDPQYRGASVWSDIADTPGLGFIGYAAEFGLPLLAFLSITLLLPYIWLRFRGAPTWITNLALMSPLVHIFGAQLNVTYPWIVSAFALALGYGGYDAEPLQTAEPPLQLSWKDEPLQLGTQTQT